MKAKPTQSIYSMVYVQDRALSYNVEYVIENGSMHFFGHLLCVATKVEYDSDLNVFFVWAETFDFYIQKLMQ